MDLEIVHAKSNKPLVTIQDQLGEYTIGELKKTLAGKKPKYRDINRYQSEDKLPNILPSDKKDYLC